MTAWTLNPHWSVYLLRPLRCLYSCSPSCLLATALLWQLAGRLMSVAVMVTVQLTHEPPSSTAVTTMNALSLSLSLPQTLSLSSPTPFSGSLPFLSTVSCLPLPTGGRRHDPVTLQAHPFPIQAHAVMFWPAYCSVPHRALFHGPCPLSEGSFQFVSRIRKLLFQHPTHADSKPLNNIRIRF